MSEQKGTVESFLDPLGSSEIYSESRTSVAFGPRSIRIGIADVWRGGVL